MVCSFYSSAFTDTKPYTAMDYQEGLCWLSVDDGPTLYACEKSCETNWVLRALALKNFENGHSIVRLTANPEQNSLQRLNTRIRRKWQLLSCPYLN